MNRAKHLLIAVSFPVLFVACATPGPQGWTEKERDWFYNTSQGSQLIPYTWMLALEQPESTALVLSDENIDSLRFLPRGFDPNDPDRAAHLPVGFVKDGNRNWFGFTCAACHTTDLEYGGKKIRIDGGGTLGDFEAFLGVLTKSVQKTYDQSDKFNRFADRVLGENHSASAGAELQERLGKYKEVRKIYNAQNRSPHKDGFARLDAVGRIFNKALAVVAAKEQKFNLLDAPVSYPFLWGTDQGDYVQWVGNVPNANVGILGRNTGEVFGVFAHVNLDPEHFPKGAYHSSARPINLIALEELVRKLNAPVWPEDVLPPIDQPRAGRGGQLFDQHCVKCHNRVERTNVNRKVVAWMENLESIQTDPTAARNIVYLKGKTGVLEGKPSGFPGSPVFREEAPLLAIVAHIVTGMLLDHVGDVLLDEFISIQQGRGGAPLPKQGNYLPDDPLNGKPHQSFLAYKGRSLTGVWATAPYLHNGSVPSLYQLLMPPDQRVKKFYVGTRKFDPVEVGFEYRTETAVSFLFNAELPSNSNSGHVYGTELKEEDKRALIEFMKTNMEPL